jgi:hypothetical protein
MSEQRRPSISELMNDTALITAAIQRAVREAVLAHARAGLPVAEGRDGQVVWVQPAEILEREAARLAAEQDDRPANNP